MADLKLFRKQNNLTQDELGEYLGIKKSFISRIENGFHNLPQEKLSKLLRNDRNWDISALQTSAGNQDVFSTYSDTAVVPAEIVEEIKEEVKEELIIQSSIPIVSEEASLSTNLDLQAYVEQNYEELEMFNPGEAFKTAQVAERVRKTSMAPDLVPGDVVLLHFINKDSIVSGDTYYFELKNLPRMIRMVKFEEDGNLRLKASNPHYDDIIIERNKVLKVAGIVCRLRFTSNTHYLDVEEARREKDAQISNMIESHTTQVDSLIKEISKIGERENRLIDILEKKL